MLDRKQFKWRVDVHDDQGHVSEETVRAYWSPTFEGIQASVGEAACIQARLKSGRPHAATAVELVA